MTAHRALHAYEELLREFQGQMAPTHAGLEETLVSGFGYLMSRLRLENVSLFWWEEDRGCLRMQYALHAETLMEGEEEISVEPESPLWKLVADREPVVLSAGRPWVAYIPLRSSDALIGAVRIERSRPLPLGRVLKKLPALQTQERPSSREYPLMEDIADILSSRLREVFRDRKHREKAQYLRAGTDVAAAIVETPRLKEMLEAVSLSIVKHLGFDRIRFYLVDPGRFEVEGMVGLQIPGNPLNLRNEQFPLRAGVNPLVDAVLSGTATPLDETSGNRVAFVPLTVNSQVVGCMAVDNLLSQQEIGEEQVSALKTLAGQIAMAVVNARLFEDIEQQAITDGLTKLYVYRYFQQRLKEEIDRADRYSYSVALVMMDVDNFKTFNDTYGHQLGDKVLEFLAHTIRGNIRRIDLAARYGGDEFILLLPEITEQEAWLMGARLLNAVKQCTLRSPDGVHINVTVTMGISLYPSDARNGRDLIEVADKALYAAKRSNRGDICLYRNISNKAEKTA